MRAVCWLLGAAACGGAQRGRADSAVRRVWRAREGGRRLRAPVAGGWCQLSARRRRRAPGGRGRGRRAAGGRVRARLHHARDRRRRARQCASCTLHVPHALCSTMRRTAHAALRVVPPGWACGPCSRGRKVVGDDCVRSCRAVRKPAPPAAADVAPGALRQRLVASPSGPRIVRQGAGAAPTACPPRLRRSSRARARARRRPRAQASR